MAGGLGSTQMNDLPTVLPPPNIGSVQLVEATDHVRRGNLLRAEGRAEEASAAYRAAINLEPEYAEAHNNLGELLAAVGRTQDAESSFHEALTLNPQYAEAHNNLGKLLKNRAAHEAAIAAFQLAIDARPTFTEARMHLAACLAKAGQNEAAARQLLIAVRSAPGSPEVREHYVDMVREVDFSAYDGDQLALLHECFGAENVDLQELVRPSVSLVKLDRSYAALASAVNSGDDERTQWQAARPAAIALLRNPLLGDLLAGTYLTDIGFECVLRRLRRLALANVSSLTTDDLALLSLMALQAWNTEYVYSVSLQDEKQVAALRTSVEALVGSGDGVLGTDAHVILAVVALYLPLADLTCATQLIKRLGGVGSPFQQVVRQALI